jgi:tRNA U55 pseudouridine synthase TruB
MIVEYDKKIGESMQQVINRFKKDYNLDPKEKVAFAGRLDPIAFGKIKLLTGEDIKEKDKLCEQDKIYSYSVIESFQTDTYDVLGLILKSNIEYKNNIFTEFITFAQPYPIFSSKTVNIDGKMVRLWDAAKNKNHILELIEIPTKQVKIFYNQLKSQDEMLGGKLFELIQERVNKVDGDFRQKETLEVWEGNINKNKMYKINHYETKISSGGYVRSIANNMGGVAFDINRIKYE